jgi:hypothetical protein
VKQPSNVIEWKKDGIYNLVYVGANQAYAEINGRRTVLVVATKPQLQYVQLYDRFGSPTEDDVRSGVCTVGDPSLVFKGDEISEPANENEWFKHSMRVTSLADAIERGGITRKDILSYSGRSSRCPFVAVSGVDGKFLGLYTDFRVEGKTSQPDLQAVYVWWNTWEEMYADFKTYGVDARQ